MNCATCAHWVPEDPQHHISGFGGCRKLYPAMYDPDAEVAELLAVVIDASGTQTGLKCKAEFGCVLHEAA